jgi:hypothetical protein
LLESSNGWDWTALQPPIVVFDPPPSNPNVEASGGQPMLGPDGRLRW